MSAIKKILVVGDSLTFGRPKHKIFNDDTWPELIAADGNKVYHRGRGGSDSKMVLYELNHIDSYMTDGVVTATPFDVCIIQVGIVDCTPRLIPNRLQKIVSYLPFLNNLLARLGKYKLLLRYFGRSWVDLKNFEKNIAQIFALSNRLSHQTIFIEIAKPIHFLLENCGDYSSVVNQYNEILRKIANESYLMVYSDCSFDLDDLFLPDGHHLTKLGHKNIAGKIRNVI